MDSEADSPSALYGDAAPTDASTSASESVTSSEETLFTDEPTFNDENIFGNDADETVFSTEDSFEQQSQDFFGEGDSTTTDVFDSGGGELPVDEESGSSILGTLWDIFMGGDD